MGKAKDALKLAIGRVAEFALPELGREMNENRNAARAPKLKRAIHYARLWRARSRCDVAAVENALAAFWKGHTGDWFHDHYAEQRFNLFREHHSAVIHALVDLVENSGARFSRLVEIGCGDGRVLAYCAGRLPGISKAIGIDINAAATKRALAEHSSDRKLSFITADARSWLMANPEPGTVLLSNGGVLEYFSQDNFERLLRTLTLSPPAAIVLIEPVAPDHDLQTQLGSFVFGRENSFSHNHRHRLSEASFDVVFEEEKQIFVRMMLMIGFKEAETTSVVCNQMTLE